MSKKRILKTPIELREKIVNSGYVAVNELIEVLEGDIPVDSFDGDKLAADKMKNAVEAKRKALDYAFEMVDILEAKEAELKGTPIVKKENSLNFGPESRAEK